MRFRINYAAGEALMRSLYLKILLWFVLAMGLVIATLLLSVAITRLERPFESSSMMAWPLRAQLAATLLEHHGPPMLAEYLHTLGRAFRAHAYLIAENGPEVSGQMVPASVRRLAELARHSGRREVQGAGHTWGLAQPEVGPSGRRYGLVLLSEFPIGQPTVQVGPLLAALLIVGGLCWWLARHITTPVRRLRAATQQLAEGKLEARAGRVVVHRHDELADLGDQFDRMAERLEVLRTSQQLLFRNVSHELRSPLARLQVALGLVRRHTGSEVSRYLERMEHEVARLNHLIGQLLTLARLESGVDGSQHEVCDVGALVQEVVADADFEARARNSVVTFVCAEACMVSGTTELLRSAVENVVRNAVRYSAEGTATEVSVYGHSARGGPHAVIEVRDHGPGIPEEELVHLFQPFYRLAHASPTGGTGLGLAITEQVVQLHGGTITAANVPGGGLVVTMRLPTHSHEIKSPGYGWSSSPCPK
jgi:two-component system sensor histidine kinase CpxA